MENFDFNAPVSATIIYEDESDEESIDIKPTIQECILKGDIMSNDLKTLKTKTPDVSLDIPGNYMPSLENDSENLCENGNTDYKIDFAKHVNTDVEVIKKRKRKITDNKEIPDKVLVSKLNDANNVRFQTLSSRYTVMYEEVRKILQSGKINNNNDKVQSESLTKNMEKSQNTVIETSVGKSEHPTKRTTTDDDINMNYKNGSDKIQRIENLNEEFHKSQRQYSNESATKSNPGPSNHDVNGNTCTNETQSVTDKNYIINIEINQLPVEQTTNQSQHINNASSKDQYADYENMYVKKFLDTVSEHLACIQNSYNYYGGIYLNESVTLKEVAQMNYTKIKNHFFSLSYGSVVNIILPKKDDPKFVKSFLENTYQIAKSKCSKFSYRYINLLFSELIKWVQKTQEEIQNTNMGPKNNETLNILEKLSQSTGGQEHKSSKKQHPSSNSTQSRHPNRNAHQVSYTQHGYIQPQVQNPIAYHKPPPPYQNQGSQMMQASFGQYLPTQPTGYLQPNTLPLYAAGEKVQPLYSDNTCMMQHTPGTMNTMPNSMNQPTVSEPWHCTSSRLSRQIHHTSMFKQYQATNSLNTVQPYTTTVHLEANTSSNSQLQPDNSIQTDSSRSSISRDSGFMSPLTFQDNNSLVREESNPSSTTPLITHVTSLNPNATLSNDGYCKICGKITKHRCIGCYKTYYCSHYCQNWDWNSHKFLCKPT